MQDELYDGRHPEASLCNPDFVKLSESYGIKAERVENYSEILPAIERAINEKAPYLVDFILADNEVV